MNTFIYKTILTLVLFFGYNVMCFYGIDSNPIYAALLVLCFILIFYFKSEARHNIIVFISAIAVVCYGLYKTWTDTSDGARSMSLMIMLPIVVFGALPYYSNKKSGRIWKSLKNILLLAFIFETGLALCERVFMYNIFPHDLPEIENVTNVGQPQYNQIINDMTEDKLMDQEDVEVFRSFGLYGHPLQNALIITTIMTFILFSEMKMKKKMFLWGLGFIAILCFNSRSSIVGNILIFFIFFIRMSSSQKERTTSKISLLLFTIIIAASIIYLMNSQSYGGRLVSMGLLDDSSAQTRIDTWNIFNNYKLSDFLFGHNRTEINQIYLASDIITTENFWIDWLLRFGLFFIIVYIIFYYIVLRNLYTNYDFSVSLITFTTFIILASTNNSLSASWMPMFIYLLCIKVFDPSKDIINNHKDIINHHR